MKATFWGTGKEHPPQIFNLTADPDENDNLALDPNAGPLIAQMEKLLLAQVCSLRGGSLTFLSPPLQLLGSIWLFSPV